MIRSRIAFEEILSALVTRLKSNCSEVEDMKKVAIALSILMGLSPFSVSAAEDVMIVYDGSNSMWGQIDGVAKIETARDVMADLIETWPQSTNLGLLSYGHRREGDCSDIELMIPPGPVDRVSFLETVNGITPRGKTPLTDAVVEAAETLSFRDNPATVVLISDGIESCQADPCSISAQLEEQGIAFTAHVIGFDIAREDQRQLSCIAENTGGTFVPAQDADELRDAIAQVQQVIETADPTEDIEPDESLPEITINAPEAVTAGTEFAVEWSETLNSGDVLQIVPTGADDNEDGNWLQLGTRTEAVLTAPAEPGLYEVRYRQRDGRVVLASIPIEVVETEVVVSAPGTVAVGTEFTVEWSETLNSGDVLQIVPAGAHENEDGNWLQLGTRTEAVLTAPAEPGLYEVRYRQREGRMVLASIPVEVIEAEVHLTVSTPVRAEADVTVLWSETLNRSDILQIVPTGVSDNEDGDWVQLGARTEVVLQAPSEPGLYEVRYRLREGRRVIAAVPLEVVPADAPLDDGAGLNAPTSAAPGETITVSWTIAPEDADRRVVLALADAPDFTWISAHPVGAETETEIILPNEPGQYEVRFLDLSNQSILGRAIIAVSE